MKKRLISVVIPVYNEEVYLQTFFDKLKKHCDTTFEYIFVDDGSTDYSPRILYNITKENSNVKVIRLANNYGKQIAITAGMKEAKGEAVIVCSIKGGEPYSAIEDMANEHFKGVDIVRGYYEKNENIFLRLWRKTKTFLLTKMMFLFGVKATLVEKPDIELYDRKVVDIINELPQKNMFLRRTNTLFGFVESRVDFSKVVSTEQEKELYLMLKKKYELQRKSEYDGEPKKKKKRLYERSFWISYCTFVTFGCLLIGFLIATASDSDYKFGWIVSTAFLGLLSLAASIVFLARGNIIKRVGILYVLGKNEELYEIDSIYTS